MNLSEEDAEGYCEIGECYRLMDMDEDALHNYQKALEIDENYADAIYGIGVLKYEKEAYLESISLLKQAIKISPYNPDYYYALAVSSMELDLIDEAEKAFEQAVKLYPYDPEFWLSYADLEFEKGNVKLALDLLKRGDHVNEKSARLKYRLAAYLLSKNDKKAGLTYFNDAFVIDKSEMDVFFNYFPEGKYLKEISKIISAQD
jgi:tetratricopeptide (TPR) repeat protein